MPENARCNAPVNFFIIYFQQAQKGPHLLSQMQASMEARMEWVF